MPNSYAKFAIPGSEVVLKRIHALGEVGAKYAADALREAAAPIVSDAQANVPVRYGLLKKSLGVLIRRYNRGLRVVAVIGPRTGFAGTDRRGRIDPALYGHLVEWGTRPHAVGKGSKIARESRARFAWRNTGLKQSGRRHPGARPSRFLTRAFDAHKNQVGDVLARKIAEAIRKEGIYGA